MVIFPATWPITGAALMRHSPAAVPAARLAAAALLASALLCACGEGEEEGGTMMPGSNCISCHDGGGEAPRFTAAGTVYAGGDSTTGLAGATVTITPSAGAAVVLTTNSAGNFYTSAALPPPLTISVAAGGFTNSMASAADTGACGACHAPAATGAGARARVHVGACANCHA